MSIVTSEIVSQSTQESGRIVARIRFEDHLGFSHYRDGSFAAGTDLDAWRIANEPVVEAELAETEINEAIDRLSGKLSPDKVPPDHQTQIEFDRRLIAALMQFEDVYQLTFAIPFWTAQEARNGVNNNARADNLGVPRPEYIEADARFGDLQGASGAIAVVVDATWEEPPSGAWL